MASFSEEVVCHHCGGLLHCSTDTKESESCYSYCLDCGRGRKMMAYRMTLEELNKERKEWEMPPITRYKVKETHDGNSKEA